jgi:hypothetical protein
MGASLESQQPPICMIDVMPLFVGVFTLEACCRFSAGWATYGVIAMANFNASACEVHRGEEDLAHETGPVHDYFWHRRYRARRSGQLVDIAILMTLLVMVSYVLLVHH